MRIVAVVLILVSGLAGCADDPDDGVKVVVIEPSAAAGPAAPEYTFVLFGEPVVEDEPREVTVRVFVNGAIKDFVPYEATPGQATQALRIYRLYDSIVSFDVVADEQVVRHGHVDMSECTYGDADAIVRVFDRVYNYADTNVEINYGCSR